MKTRTRRFSYLAEELDIDLVALGVIAASTGREWLEDVGDEADLRNSALIVATDGLRPEIHKCLCKAYGNEIALYSRMSRTRHSVHPDETDDNDDDGEEFEVTGPNSCALQFVMDGFKSGC